MNTVRILGIDPGLRITGFSSGRSLGSLNRLRRLAFTETSNSSLFDTST
jgi:Holliday junction resolvasome RuvABC endonuclease subunit